MNNLSPKSEQLHGLLRAAKWLDESTELVAPNGTMWLHKDALWAGSGAEFLLQMENRLTRLLANEEYVRNTRGKSFVAAIEDTRSLIGCLREVYGKPD